MKTPAFVILLAIALLTGLALAMPSLAQPFADAPLAQCPGSDPAFDRKAEELIRAGIDAERAQFAPDAPPLAADPDLAGAAETRSCDMAEGRQAFSHEDEQGHFIAEDMVTARFGPYGAIGENIMKMGSVFAVGTKPFSPDEFARDAVAGWMKSPEHRANILNPRFDMSGIGVAMVGDQAFATQVFWGPPRIVRKRDRQSP